MIKEIKLGPMLKLSIVRQRGYFGIGLYELLEGYGCSQFDVWWFVGSIKFEY